MREPVDVIVSGASPFACRAAVDVVDLADSDWISVDGGFHRRCAAVDLGDHRVVPRVTQRMLDFTTIEALVAAGHGIALMLRHAVRHPGGARCLVGVRAARVYAEARPGRTARVRRQGRRVTARGGGGGQVRILGSPDPRDPRSFVASASGIKRVARSCRFGLGGQERFLIPGGAGAPAEASRRVRRPKAQQS